MQNFENFLASLVGGDEPDLTQLVKRKKNGPNAQSLLPSEAALGDIAQGASADMWHPSPDTGTAQAAVHSRLGKPTGSLQAQPASALKGGGGGLIQGLKDISTPAPWQQVPQIEQNPVRENAIRSAIAQPPPMSLGGSNMYDRQWDDAMNPFAGNQGYAYGGTIPYGDTGQVGDEYVTATPDGVVVTPNPDDEQRKKDAAKEQLLALAKGNGGLQSAGTSISTNISPRPPMTVGAQDEPDVPGQPDEREDLPLNTPTAPTTGRDPRKLLSGSPDDLPSLYGQLNEIQNEKPSKWKDAGYGALQGLQNYVNHTNSPIQSYSEMRKAQQERPILAKIGAIEHQRDSATADAYKQAEAERQRALGHAETTNAQTAADKLVYDRLDAVQKQIWDDYKLRRQSGGFHLSNPADKALADKAAKLGMDLAEGDSGDHFTFQWSPDGRLVTGNTKTGTSVISGQTYQKPPDLENIKKRNIQRRQDFATAQQKYDAELSGINGQVEGLTKQFNDLDVADKTLTSQWYEAQQKKRDLEGQKSELDPEQQKPQFEDINKQLAETDKNIKTLSEAFAKNAAQRSEYKSKITELGTKKPPKPVMEELENEDFPTDTGRTTSSPSGVSTSYKGQVFNDASIDKIYNNPPPALKGMTKKQIRDYIQTHEGTVQ